MLAQIITPQGLPVVLLKQQAAIEAGSHCLLQDSGARSIHAPHRVATYTSCSSNSLKQYKKHFIPMACLLQPSLQEPLTGQLPQHIKGRAWTMTHMTRELMAQTLPASNPTAPAQLKQDMHHSSATSGQLLQTITHSTQLCPSSPHSTTPSTVCYAPLHPRSLLEASCSLTPHHPEHSPPSIGRSDRSQPTH